MSAPGLALARCPRCGTEFHAYHPPQSRGVGWSYCPSCGQPTPILPLRDPPPLFSWEVYPELYPAPRGPRQPDPRTRRLLAGSVLVAALLLLGLAAATSTLGALSYGPYHHEVGGNVVALDPVTGALVPLPGAQVNLTGLSGPNSTTSAAGGGFSFSQVPTGEHTLGVAAPGYGPVSLELFLSPFFVSPQGNLTDLEVVLIPSTGGAVRALVSSPFPDLENYLATLLSVSVLQALAGAVGVWGAYSIARGRPPSRGVVGSVFTVAGPTLTVVGGLTLVLFQPTALLLVPLVLAGLLGGVTTALLVLLQRPLYLSPSPGGRPPSP